MLELKFGYQNDVMDVAILEHCGYEENKAGGPTGFSILTCSSRIAELSKRLELALKENAKLREDNGKFKKESRQLREELSKTERSMPNRFSLL